MIYLHCWGGHGRAGTITCLLLHWLYGLNALDAMARCQFVHDLRRVPIVVGSPQTQTQRDQVCRVVASSLASDKLAAADASDLAHRAESDERLRRQVCARQEAARREKVHREAARQAAAEQARRAQRKAGSVWRCRLPELAAGRQYDAPEGPSYKRKLRKSAARGGRGATS